MKGITIELFRVSKEGKYLDLKFSCPRYYYFECLTLSVEILNGMQFKNEKYELGDYLFTIPVDDENGAETDPVQFNKTKTQYVVRIPLEDALDITNPAIYYGEFEAKFNYDWWKSEHKDETLFCSLDYPETLNASATTSDVNFAYRCMLDDLIQDANICGCPQVSDEAVRKYLILYGHQASLTTGDIEIAKLYFKLLNNCFNKCGAPERMGEPHKGCGCVR